MILVTHDQNDAMLISDRIMFINNNTIAQFDRPEVIYNSPINLATAKFVGFPEIIKLANSENKYIRPSKLKIEKTQILQLELLISKVWEHKRLLNSHQINLLVHLK